MPRLQDGSWAPAHFGLGDLYDRSAPLSMAMFNNAGMRTGYLVAVHYPGDLGYEKAVEPVYDIVAPVSDGDNIKSWQQYDNARMASDVGGTLEEYSIIRPRTPLGWKKGSAITDEVLKECARVKFFCANGRANEAFVVGFLRHDNHVQNDKSLGHYWQWKFNGINSTINKDGEYSVEFSGAILDENTNKHIAPPENTTGTFFRFTKEGGWTVDDAKGESISLDKTNKAINILARSMNTTTSEGDYNLTSKGKTNVQATGNAILNGAKVYVGAEGSSEPLVKGNELANTLDLLVRAFLESPLIGQAGPFPCILHPSLRGKLMAWKNTHSRKNTAPFLSRKGYVE